MLRRCDGTDPNLLDAGGHPDHRGRRPCRCGRIFDDVSRMTVYPHALVAYCRTCMVPIEAPGPTCRTCRAIDEHNDRIDDGHGCTKTPTNQQETAGGGSGGRVAETRVVDVTVDEDQMRKLVARVMRESNPTAEDARDVADFVSGYKALKPGQNEKYEAVRKACADFIFTVFTTVPSCADRTVAIRKIREARMDANSAIALEGTI